VLSRHYRRRTVRVYLGWIRRFIIFHGKRHPDELGGPEVGAFLSSLATDGNVSSSTQNQALAALLFLYRQVLGRELEWLGDLVHAQRPKQARFLLGPSLHKPGISASIPGKRRIFRKIPVLLLGR
jgi:hypothetical protein